VHIDGFLATGAHSRQCRICGVAYCPRCKRSHMVRKRGSLINSDAQVIVTRLSL